MPRPTGTPAYAQKGVKQRVGYWLAWVFGVFSQFDTALGPLEAPLTYVAFFIAGWLVLTNLIKIFTSAGWVPIVSFPIGGIVGLLVAIPARGLRAPWGRLGLTGATLLAILASCGTGSVTQLANISKKTATAVRMEMGDTDAAEDYCIKETSYQLGLLTREETDRLCGYKTVQEDGETVRYQEVPKPSPFSYIVELVKLSAVVVVLVFIFKKP